MSLFKNAKQNVRKHTFLSDPSLEKALLDGLWAILPHTLYHPRIGHSEMILKKKTGQHDLDPNRR